MTRDTKDGQVAPDCPDWPACLVTLETLDHLDRQGREETGVKQEEEVHQVLRVQTEMLASQAHRVHLVHLEMMDDRVLLDLLAHLVHQDMRLAEVLLLGGNLGDRPFLGPRDPIRCMAMIRILRNPSPTPIWYRSEKQLTVSKYLLEPKTHLHVPAKNWHNRDQS